VSELSCGFSAFSWWLGECLVSVDDLVLVSLDAHVSVHALVLMDTLAWKSNLVSMDTLVRLTS
jgi:hypothetical protein